MSTKLTFEKKVTAAYFSIVRGLDQHDIASLLNVNQGRVSEAVTTVRKAFGEGKAVVGEEQIKLDRSSP